MFAISLIFYSLMLFNFGQTDKNDVENTSSLCTVTPNTNTSLAHKRSFVEIPPSFTMLRCIYDHSTTSNRFERRLHLVF